MKKESCLIPVYSRVGPVFVKGKGSYLWDSTGRRYLDLFPGWGVGVLGHAHPRLVNVLKTQASKLVFLPNNLHHQWQEELADTIIRRAFPGKVFFANSGAEAVEAALKLSRLYGEGKRYEIITFKDSFHGRTFGALSATGQDKYKTPFRPVLPGFKEARLNDFQDFTRKITDKTVGVIVELIQGEGGINVVSSRFIREVAQVCRQKDMLLIFDEVQTGMGHTGKLFCYQHYKVIPDIMLLSKGLGAGIPISCMVVKRRFSTIMKSGHHASTFGGNPLATRVALEVFRIIEEESLLENVKIQSHYLFQQLTSMQKTFHCMKQVRGKGLMVGIEFDCPSFPIFKKAFDSFLIVNSTHENILRIMPALTVGRKEINLGLGILRDVIRQCQ